MNRRWHCAALAAWLWLATTAVVSAQVVGVTVELETNRIVVGQSTVLHVYAQVLTAYRTNADQIFSWYVDVLNTNGAAATGNFSAMIRSASDNHPQTSSNGFNSAANRLGIYDTFLNQARAGVTNRIELMRFPIVGIAAGQAQFSVRHGSGVTNLSEDFIVAPISGEEFLNGGDYSLALTNLTVLSPPVSQISCLTLAHTNLPGGFQRLTLCYCPAAGFDHYVEFRDHLTPGSGWQVFPGGPFNAGLYLETNAAPTRFYRIHAVPAGTFFPTVSSIGCLTLASTNLPGGFRQVTLRYCPATGYDHYVEFRDQLSSNLTWQAFPGGPFNAGLYRDTNAAPIRFYRIHAVPAGTTFPPP